MHYLFDVSLRQGFQPSESEFDEIMELVDKDKSGEVDYLEFASRISEILGDGSTKQDEGSGSGDTLSTDAASQSRPSTASAESSSSRVSYQDLYNPYEQRARPSTAPALPRGISQGSWLSRSDDGLAMVGGVVKQATEWQGIVRTVPVARSFSTDDVDGRWSFEAQRTSEEQEAVAQIRRVDQLNVKYDVAEGYGLKGLGALVTQLEKMQPNVANAFVKRDTERSGTCTRTEFKEVLYSLNVPTTDAQVERVFSSLAKENQDTISWSKFVDAVNPQRKKSSPRGKYTALDISEYRPPRISKAAKLLPKTDVASLITHTPKPRSYGVGSGNAPWYSAGNSQQVSPVFKATSVNSSYHITKDGINPGSTLDHFERETRWIDRHQQAAKDHKAARSKARAQRTSASLLRIDNFHREEREKALAKTEKRVNAFRQQKGRYIRRCRFLDPWNNSAMIAHHGVDTTSAMHSEV